MLEGGAGEPASPWERGDERGGRCDI